MLYGFTGPRALTPAQTEAAASEIGSALARAGAVAVGCAAGVDELAREQAAELGLPLAIFEAAGENPAMPHAAKLQARSKRMVRALAANGGTLLALPNKPCPQGLTPDRWQGSGTWGTVAYAHKLGVRVELAPLVRVPLPDWLAEKQMALI